MRYIKQALLSVINPLPVKWFIQSKMFCAKADKRDAIMLVAYGNMMDPALWEPDAAHYTQAQLFAGCCYKKSQVFVFPEIFVIING